MTEETEKPDTSQPEADVESAQAIKKPVSSPVRPSRKQRAKQKNKSQSQQRKGVGFTTVFVMMLLAVIGGAVLSQVYSQYFGPQKQSASEQQLRALEAKMEASHTSRTENFAHITARLEALETTVKSSDIAGNTSFQILPADIKTRLAALEARAEQDLTETKARLQALETEPANIAETANDIPDALITRLEALESAQNEASYQERLKTLEDIVATPRDLNPEAMTRIQALETSLENLPEPVDLSQLEARLTSLEQEAETLKSTQAEVIKATTPIPPFPSEAVLGALENTQQSSDKGWLEKTFDKYVLADNAEAIKTVSHIESLLQQGRVDMALEHVQSLPEPAKVAAQDWVDTVGARRR